MKAMEVYLTPERQAQLNDYAQRHGKDPSEALDDVLADALEWERQEHQQTVQAALEGYADVKAGRTRSASEFLEELCTKLTLSAIAGAATLPVANSSASIS